MPTTTIELFKEEMKFSAGHFTIFSATERENLHGHNFTVHIALTGEVGPLGLLADYRPLKRAVIERCRLWNETFLLPGVSPHLDVKRDDNGDVRARFDGRELFFLARDVTVLPCANTTLEELSRVIGEAIVDGGGLVADLTSMRVKVSSGPGQWADWSWP